MSEQKGRGLLRSSGVVSLCTMLSRILGLIRDVVIAFFVGASANADCFFVAFKIPNFLRRLFAEGAFSQAFVPVLAEYRERGNEAAVILLVQRVSGALGGVLLAVTTLAVVGAPMVAALFAPGFLDQPEKHALTSELIRITFPYLFFISLTGFAGAVLNSYGQFAVPAFTPVLLNISLISAAIVAGKGIAEPVYALSWGVFLAGLVQFAFQLPFLSRIGQCHPPAWAWRDEGVQKVLKLMAPALFGVSVSQINLLLDTVLASFLPTGSVSWLYYSDRLVELPLGVFAIAIATVILPSLSRQQSAADIEQFNRTLDWALRSVLLVAVPAAVALCYLAEPIISTLFLYGELTPRDVDMAALSLRAYSLGLVAFMLIKVLAPGYYARQDMRTPVSIGIKAMVANMVLNLALVIPLHHYWQIGHAGLALATACSAWLNALLLWRGLRRVEVYRPLSGWSLHLMRLVSASVVMLVCLFLLLPEPEFWPSVRWWQRVIEIAILCGSGLVGYLVVLYLLGVRLKHFRGQVTTL